MDIAGPITVDTPLGDTLVFRSMSASEQLGAPFEYTVDLFSQDPNVALPSLLGELITVHLQLQGGELRHFNGYVAQFESLEPRGEYSVYRATLRPWLWLLSQTTNCKIFQAMTIPAIVEKVFRDLGFSDFKLRLRGSYPVLEYVVQYRESDFNFVSRLMEHAGIYYYFTHSDGLHEMVLCDSYGAHDRTPGCETLPYYPANATRWSLVEHVTNWRVAQVMTPGAAMLRDYDFKKPNADLAAKRSSANEHAYARFEIFDYPGQYVQRSDGETYARIRLEEAQGRYQTTSGRANARPLSVGALFELKEHPRDDQNREYLLIGAQYQLNGHALESGGHADPSPFVCVFQAMDSKRPYRSPRTTHKPVVRGVQTATVVGKSGEEIWTDEYGRVKVQFHWDRLGAEDENSSCWVRVSQAWAGSGFGAIHIPRIGQEVIVDFLEGDPDQPIITGRVYNAHNMPPYGLPGSATQSGIKSQSSKGGSTSTSNELRFEDKMGAEEVFLHAQKDQNIVVNDAESHSVGSDRSKTIGNNETVQVGADRTETVGKNESITIGLNQTIAVGVSRSETVGTTETIAIGAARTTTVGAADVLTVGAFQAVNVGGARTITVGAIEAVTIAGKSVLSAASRTATFAGGESTTIGGGRTVSVAKDESVTVAGKRTIKVTGNDGLNVGGKLNIEAADEIVLKTGDASIIMKKNGDITIKGKNITVNGSGKVNVKASGDVTIKGSKINQN